jgi:hypothetical protein
MRGLELLRPSPRVSVLCGAFFGVEAIALLVCGHMENPDLPCIGHCNYSFMNLGLALQILTGYPLGWFDSARAAQASQWGSFAKRMAGKGIPYRYRCFPGHDLNCTWRPTRSYSSSRPAWG